MTDIIRFIKVGPDNITVPNREFTVNNSSVILRFSGHTQVSKISSQAVSSIAACSDKWYNLDYKDASQTIYITQASFQIRES